jgi:hypothetical protein
LTTAGAGIKIAESASSVIQAVALSADAVFEAGVDASDLQIIVKAVTQAQQDTISGFVDTGRDAGLQVLDIQLLTADGLAAKLVSGKVAVTIAKDTSISYSAIRVYHFADDGKVEELQAAVSDTTITFETTGFSPFAVEYVAAEAVTEAGTSSDNTPSAPKTGDVAKAEEYMLFVMLAAGIILASKKRRSAQ